MNCFPADDETPIDMFWNHLKKSSSSVFLVENANQFIHAQLLQYQLGNKKYQSGNIRIFNPAVLNALWHIADSHSDELMSSGETLAEYSYGSCDCTCNIGDGVVEVNSIKFYEETKSDKDSEGLIKGGVLFNQIRQNKLPNLLLLDIIEYNISIGVFFNGTMRDYRSIVNKSTIPLRITDEIPVDLIQDSEIYLYIDDEKVDVDLRPHIDNIENEIVSLTVEVGADKSIWLSFGKDGNPISLGQILSENQSSNSNRLRR